MEHIQGGPVNFFMGGGRYISDKFNMQILDTANPNCFENLNLTSVVPDMMSDYINSDKIPENFEKNESKGGFWNSLINAFSSSSQVSPQEEKF